MYHPTDADVQWAESVIRLLKHGGRWLYPAIGWVFEIDKEKLTLTLVANPAGIDPTTPGDPADLWDKTVATFAEFHYTVINGLVAHNN
jgi:hypothetical protein